MSAFVVQMPIPEIALKEKGYGHDVLQPWIAGKTVALEAVFLKDVPDYDDWFRNILMKNQLCVLSSNATSKWKSREFWPTAEEGPNLDYLSEQFGDANAPVADCTSEKFCAHPKCEMTVGDFIHYWTHRNNNNDKDSKKNLYLKDWHFQRLFPGYKAYNPPAVLCSDWMNEFWDTQQKESGQGDDYRFVYMGPSGTWTPFHCDVLASYSWSANICGRKKWIFYPPGTEDKLKDKFGQLVFDLADLRDEPRYPQASSASGEAIVVMQNPGEIIFVPSGWHHQVWNVEDAISINHNWVNGCSAHLTWEHVKARLAGVEKEISDCRDMDGWAEQCQLILKADCGIDYEEFYKFLCTIAQHRLHALAALDLTTGVAGEQDRSTTEECDASTAGISNILCLYREECFQPCRFCCGEELVCAENNCGIKENCRNAIHFSKGTTRSRLEEEGMDEVKNSNNCDMQEEQSSDLANHCPEPEVEGADLDVAGELPVAVDEESSRKTCRHCGSHADCPHWAHCGPNLARFDLGRVKVIVEDMLLQPGFEDILCAGGDVRPRELLSLIHTALMAR